MHLSNAKVVITLSALFALAAAGLAGDAKPIEPTKPLVPIYPAGERMPLLWEHRATGARAGQEGALVCTYAYQPMVAIWCQDLSPAVVRLVKKIDAATRERSKPANFNDRLGSYLVLICDSRARVKVLQALAEKEEIGHTVLSVGVVNPGVPADSWKALREKLGEAQTTILLAAPPGARIKASYAYRRGELTDEEIDRIVADVARLLPPAQGDRIDVKRVAAADPPGSLLLFGGRHDDLPNEMRDLLFDLAGGKEAKVVVVPTAMASADNPQSYDEVLQPWTDRKPRWAVVLHTRNPKTADDPAFVKPLTEASAVWITHGHRDRLLKAYRGTLVVKELKKLLARGGIIGGAGSGAAVLGELAIDRANEDVATEPGLGLLPGFLIEDGESTERLAEALAINPTRPALELRPGAGMLIRGGKLHVPGKVPVAVHIAPGAGHAAHVDKLIPGVERSLQPYLRAAALRAPKPFSRRRAGRRKPPVS
jgi:cyanophycinase